MNRIFSRESLDRVKKERRERKIERFHLVEKRQRVNGEKGINER